MVAEFLKEIRDKILQPYFSQPKQGTERDWLEIVDYPNDIVSSHGGELETFKPNPAKITPASNPFNSFKINESNINTQHQTKLSKTAEI